MEKGSLLTEFVAGQVAGVAGILVVYPLDTVKTRLQVSPQYKSGSDVLRSMVKNDGFKSLYRGIASPALGFGLTFAISFSSYSFACDHIKKYNFQNSVKNVDVSVPSRSSKDGELTLTEMMAAGAFTGIVQSPARQLMERVKSVMQIWESDKGGKGKSQFNGILQCAAHLVRTEGVVKGLGRGFSSVLLREVPQFTVYYPTYHVAKGALGGFFSNEQVCQFLAGGVAGTVQWLPPFFFADVLKSRMQTARPDDTNYNSIASCTRSIYRVEGFRGFFRGLAPALCRAFPLHAIIFITYESTISLICKKDSIS